MKKPARLILFSFVVVVLHAHKLFGQAEDIAAAPDGNLCNAGYPLININRGIYLHTAAYSGDSCNRNSKPGLNNPAHGGYNTSLAFDIPAGSIIAGGFLYAEFIIEKCPPITTYERNNLNLADLPGIDKWVLSKYNPAFADKWDKLSYIPVGIAMTGAAEAVFLGPDYRSDLNNFIILSESVALDLALTEGIKNTVCRFRPYTYITDKTPDSLNSQLIKSARESFPSGHTSTVACLSFYTAMMMNKYSDNCTLKTTTWIAAATLPAITGLTRNLAGWHFTTDVIAGYAIGAICGIGIPLLHDYLLKKKKINR